MQSSHQSFRKLLIHAHPTAPSHSHGLEHVTCVGDHLKARIFAHFPRLGVVSGGVVWHEHLVWVPWRATVERPVICSERFAGAVAHERVVPVLSVEGRPWADDPAVLSDEPGRGVIAVLSDVVGTEDPAGVPGLDPFGEACRGGAGGDHGASLAPGRDEMQGEDRQGVEGAVCEDHGVRPIRLSRHPVAAARGEVRRSAQGGSGAAAGKISAPRASPAAFRRTNSAYAVSRV